MVVFHWSLYLARSLGVYFGKIPWVFAGWSRPLCTWQPAFATEARHFDPFGPKIRKLAVFGSLESEAIEGPGQFVIPKSQAPLFGASEGVAGVKQVLRIPA